MCVVDLLRLNVENEAVMNIIGQAASDLGNTSSLPFLKNLWATGGEGLTMFHSSDDKFSLSVVPPVRTRKINKNDEVQLKSNGWSQEEIRYVTY